MSELVAQGDLAARRVVTDAGRAVGRALADLCNHLNPEAIVVGGDLSLAGERSTAMPCREPPRRSSSRPASSASGPRYWERRPW
jgi:predicted NBD/HSP70 family sugar kinase